MTPKAIEFNRDIVLQAAVEVVRRHGLDRLSARSVAASLKASVAPVYSIFRSMAGLERAVLDEARRLMDEQTRRAFSEIPFLNIGVGIVTFARDEPRLFSALFLSRHPFQDILATFHNSVLDRMKMDTMLQLLPEASLKRFLDSLWFYTLGLATALVYGQLVNADDEHLISFLRNMGNILTLGEVMGITDSESPGSERAWQRAFKERGIPWPEQMKCAAARQSPASVSGCRRTKSISKTKEKCK